MGKTYVLYNPLAGNGTCAKTSEKLKDMLTEELTYIDYCAIPGGIDSFFKSLEKDDRVILCGGDGTINHLANSIDADRIENEICFFPAGSGNDFYHDVMSRHPDKLIPLNAYIKNLPFVEVKGIKKRFLNGIGYGIDGYCCEEGDRQRERKPGKPVNYALIALKGLVYDFSRTDAVITVDGRTYEYSDVWMAPAMNGRYYGGGMMCAPNQDRLKSDDKVSVIIVSSKSRLKLLTAFLSIFKGEHLKYRRIVTEIKGRDVTVRFNNPTALQIDGETVSGVTEYTVYRQ